MNILGRIEKEIMKNPIHEKMRKLNEDQQVHILDYKPSLKKEFYQLAGPWLLGVLKGTLEEEDKFTLNNPDQALPAQRRVRIFCYL
ncbi:MAG: hypothetical protein WDO15_21600 [Bacteroidota bacterium]